MKKRGRSDKEGKAHHSGGGKKAISNDDKNNKNTESDLLDDDSENQGFGTWLRSANGVEMMRMFVIANSLVVFVTMAWPNMQQTFYILKDYIIGEED